MTGLQSTVYGMWLFGDGFRHMWEDWNWLCLLIIGGIGLAVWLARRGEL